MRIDMTDEERDILIRWKKRSDTYRLVRMKAEAIVYAARGVGLDTVAEMVERAEGTVREWLSQWRQARLGPRGNRSRRGRERGEAQAGAEGRSWRRFSVDRPRRQAPGPVSGTPRPLEDVASDQVRSRVQVRVLLTCCSCTFRA